MLTYLLGSRDELSFVHLLRTPSCIRKWAEGWRKSKATPGERMTGWKMKEVDGREKFHALTISNPLPVKHPKWRHKHDRIFRAFGRQNDTCTVGYILSLRLYACDLDPALDISLKSSRRIIQTGSLYGCTLVRNESQTNAKHALFWEKYYTKRLPIVGWPLDCLGSVFQ